MPQDIASVKILRFDPAEDAAPRYETYQVPYDGMSVLQVLRYIVDTIDPSLSFRYGCSGPHEVRCGACEILYNGHPVLSCQQLAEPEMVLAPHPKFELIKDLVVDMDRVRQKVEERQTWVDITVDPAKCDGCRDCVRVCLMGVWDVKKVNGKAVAVPVDAASCCGRTCLQCSMFCHAQAITISEKDKEGINA